MKYSAWCRLKRQYIVSYPVFLILVSGYTVFMVLWIKARKNDHNVSANVKTWAHYEYFNIHSITSGASLGCNDLKELPGASENRFLIRFWTGLSRPPTKINSPPSVDMKTFLIIIQPENNSFWVERCSNGKPTWAGLGSGSGSKSQSRSKACRL